MKKLTSETLQEYKNYLTWTVFESAAIVCKLDPGDAITNDNIYRHTGFIEKLNLLYDAIDKGDIQKWDRKGEKYNPPKMTNEEIKKFAKKMAEEPPVSREILDAFAHFGFDNNEYDKNSIIDESKGETLDSTEVLKWAIQKGYSLPHNSNKLQKLQELEQDLDSQKSITISIEEKFNQILVDINPDLNAFWEILKRKARDSAGNLNAIESGKLYDLALEIYNNNSNDYGFLKRDHIDYRDFYISAADRRKKIIGNILIKIIETECPLAFSIKSLDLTVEGLFKQFKKISNQL